MLEESEKGIFVTKDSQLTLEFVWFQANRAPCRLRPAQRWANRCPRRWLTRQHRREFNSSSIQNLTHFRIHSAIQTGIAELSNLVAKLSDAGSILPSTREEPQSPNTVQVLYFCLWALRTLLAFQETPLSPHLSRSSSKRGVVKNQIISEFSFVK